MRPRFVIFLLVLVAAMVALIFWRRPVQHSGKSEPASTIQPATNSPASHTSVAGQGVPLAPSRAAVSPANPRPPITNEMGLPEVIKKFVESKNVPVDFYGQVIDQDSNALSGVDIKVVVRHWIVPDPVETLAGSKDIPLEQVTGADGHFELTGATGDAFDIESIHKDGYEAEPGPRTFGAEAGSFENPVIFKMWSANIHEKLITGGKSFQIVPDGRPYFVNLADDTISESGPGDLKVWVQYTNQVIGGQLYDWAAGIEVINGGLLEEPLGMAMYEAPAGGYVPSFQLQQQIRGGQSGEIGERQFYLQLENGQEYAQMSIDLYAPFNNQIPGLIRLSYAINPSGSRILR